MGLVVVRVVVVVFEGFLISIVTLGSTLKKKSLGDWKSALKRLQDSKPLVITKGLKIPHVCLQLSYDNLTDELTKSLLLLCCIFPKDHEIDLEDLFRFGRGLGLTKTSETMEKSRREIEIAVNILKDSCLLLKVSNKERVKMHDMVRDVAWLGFWVVHKLVLTEDGSVDISTAQFVAWAIRILAAIMILQVFFY